MTRALLAGSLACLALLGACGGDGDGEADLRRERFHLSVETAREAGALLEEGRAEAARETFLRAFDHALGALKLPGELDPVSVWNQLSYVSVELGRWSPGYLGRAVRYAEAAIEAAPDWEAPWFNLGDAYGRAGLFEQAERAYRKGIERTASGEAPPEVRENLVRVLYNRGAAKMAEESFRIGAAGAARRLFERAWAELPDASLNARVDAALTELNLRYKAEVNAAYGRDDELEVARVHARHGFPDLADEALSRARNRIGRTPELRWVEARYVEELGGHFYTDPEQAKASFERAGRHFDDLLARGEKLVQAAAGFARVMRALRRVDVALERVGEFPRTSAELRVALIRLRLDRIQALPEKATEREAEEFGKIHELLLGGMEPLDRADLLLEVGSVALERGRIEETRRAIQEFQRRFSSDLRITILEAGLQKLAGDPLEGVDDGGRDG